jgi:alpha-galactosidase
MWRARQAEIHVLLSLAFAFTASATRAQVVSVGDASIAHDARSGAWTITAGGASMALRIDPAADYGLTSLRSPSGVEWLRVPAADTTVTVNGARLTFGSRSDGFVYASASTRSNGQRLELDASFLLPTINLSVTRHIAVASGSPTFEVWTTFQSLDGPVTLANLDSFQAVVTEGAINWLGGEQPIASDPSLLDSEFARRQQALAPNRPMLFGSTARSSEGTVPWIAINGAADELYVALMWSGAWSATITTSGSGLSMDWGLGSMSTVIDGTAVDGPHALIGIARGALPGASEALRTYVLQGLRGGRPISPLVTYNTWYAYGTAVDDDSMRREMARAASMGVELFVIDAGWYVGADTSDTTNFTPGLGSWTADPDRFPDGLAALSAYAHSLGMKFGIWVEPERVDQSLIGRNGLDEAMLATAAGDYQSPNSAMICLAGQAGRQWAVDHLIAFLDAVQPDYLKWDNNLWLNCDREGHGHGATDANFQHNTALYEIFAMLHQRYPSLLIENCSSGGNRMDLGMLQFTDVAWMSDQTAPAVRVRHNLEGLSLIFPPAYLLSFLTELGWEPLHNAPDLASYTRSRMLGVFGLSFRSFWLTDDDISAIAKQVAFYKRLRPLVTTATATLLTTQANGDESQWDILQESGTNGGLALFAFNGTAAPSSTTVSPVNLAPGTVYQVISIDGNNRGMMTGGDLMGSGLDLTRSAVTGAQILLFFPQR